MSKKKDKVKKKEIVEVEKKGRCLRCGKPMGKNMRSCQACRRKDKLKRKANTRGKSKDYYLR